MAETAEITVDGFYNRGSDDHPYGYIDFTDGLRIGFAPETRDANGWGLFIPDQQPYPYNVQGQELTQQHVYAARAFVEQESLLGA
jgi:hypothetical protein